VVLLHVAGHETTVNLIGNSVLALLRHPDRLRRWRTDPSLDAVAVAELLRYDGPVQHTVRVAMRPMRFEGADGTAVVVEPGHTILTVLGAANRDPSMFETPHSLLLDRPNAGRHMAFSAGIHSCLGASLAKLEATVAITRLVRRFGEIDLAAEPGQDQRIHGHPVTGVHEHESAVSRSHLHGQVEHRRLITPVGREPRMQRDGRRARGHLEFDLLRTAEDVRWETVGLDPLRAADRGSVPDEERITTDRLDHRGGERLEVRRRHHDQTGSIGRGFRRPATTLEHVRRRHAPDVVTVREDEGDLFTVDGVEHAGALGTVRAGAGAHDDEVVAGRRREVVGRRRECNVLGEQHRTVREGPAPPDVDRRGLPCRADPQIDDAVGPVERRRVGWGKLGRNRRHRVRWRIGRWAT